jgi:hypothetical protein
MVIETMDGGAFGSPVAAINVANTAIGSVGQRVVRASRIRLFQDPSGSTHRNIQVPDRGSVELLGPRASVVGKGVIYGNIKCGMELNIVTLCPSEVAIRVVEVRDGSVWTGEIMGERLGQCVGLIIRWKRTLLRNLEERPFSIGELSEGQFFSFPALVMPEFEFDEGDTFISYDNGPPIPMEILAL